MQTADAHLFLGPNMITKKCEDKNQRNVRDKPNPSYVEVPRPNSSIIIRDFSDAPFKMDAVSSISCIKVETPRSCQQNVKQNKYKFKVLQNYIDRRMFKK